MPTKPRLNCNQQEDKLALLLDDFNRFKKYKKVMKQLMDMVDKGASVEEIYEKFGSAAAARLVMMALSETDTRTAQALIKEVHDRSIGRSKERIETLHKYENLTDSQLEDLISAENDQVVGLQKEKTTH